MLDRFGLMESSRPERLGRAIAAAPSILEKEKTMKLQIIQNFLKDEEGQDLVEYALLLVFLALAAIAVLPTLGSSVNRVFSQSNSALNAS
jgi:Flp pilus assembly pilin Flp